MSEDLKSQFPLIRNTNLVYLDNAATTQKPNKVIDAISDYYQNHNANVHRGIYPLAEKATEIYEEARIKVAKFINADPAEIIFVPGATEAINWIANSLYRSGFIRSEPRVIMSDLEHHSNILPWQSLTPEVIQYINLGENFELDEVKFMDEADIFTTVHVSNVTGTIVPTKDLIQQNDYPYSIIDATQSIAHMPIDVKDMGADFIVFSAHKVYGPMGIGVVYAKKEILEQLDPFMKGGGMIDVVTRESSTWGPIPQRFEAGTPNVAGAVGLGAAIDFINDFGWDRIQAKENDIRKYLIKQLEEIDGVKIYHPSNVEAAPVVSFDHKKVHAHDIAQYLGDNNVCVRAGHHCTQILHNEVIESPATVRVSIGIYNTIEDIDVMINFLQEAIGKFTS